MSKYKIERNIPRPDIPSTVRNRYPFGEMEVDDSFAVGIEELNLVRSSASWYGTRNGVRFSIRRHGNAYRCWRIA